MAPDMQKNKKFSGQVIVVGEFKGKLMRECSRIDRSHHKRRKK
jgi:hypothetical protein